ncbi:MAG: UDP-N-acetylglucosamine 1-carboxyvinyltransferase [Candidatus Saccharibacteria bacterium]|nr:UDP-N-acetylglucosamine 1-carboxyvinyltransferase [Candidatus Saccharibacteria bacterium]
MSTTNEKVGQLIYQLRQERGLTQAEFARRMNTSQSAVNRIEKGRQNLSLEMLGRISDVLQKPIISISGQSINFRVEGGQELSGTIHTKTAKNSAVALLCASLLNKGTTKLIDVPKIEEVNRIVEVLQSIGVSIRWFNGNSLEIKPPEKLDLDAIDSSAARRTRSVIMLAGPLLHDSKQFRIPYAGGCKLGKRSVQAHLYALEDFGVKTQVVTGFYNMKVKDPTAADVVLYEMGETPTENILMAAARAKGTSSIKMASSNYNIQDLCHFLKKLGVKISGIGTSSLKIEGVPHIKKNISYRVCEDPLDAMFFVSTAVTTNSQITIKHVPFDFLEVELMKLEKMGLKMTSSAIYKSKNGWTNLTDITIHKHNGSLKAPVEKLHPLPYPGLLPDNLPFFVPIAAVAKGRTLLHDWMYENRAIYFTELSRLGANVELIDAHRVYVRGITKFSAADITCPPALRPAAILLIGMLAAEGTSKLRNIYSINRGYENIAERLNSLGAKVEVLNEI